MELRKITQTELNKRLESHKIWLASASADAECLDMCGYDFYGLSFNNAVLKHSIFSFSKFENTDFLGANLECSKFLGASFENTKFNNSVLRWAKFNNASIVNSTFEDSILIGSKFNKTFLRNVDFENADVFGAEFNGAELQDTEFSFAQNDDIFGTNFIQKKPAIKKKRWQCD